MIKTNLVKKLNELSIIFINISYINDSLMKHLDGTYFLLKSSSANESLYLAGLCHALYGTSGFANHLINIQNRCQAQFILGEIIEKIIYTYCACDQDYFKPQIGVTQCREFLNGFTNEKYFLNTEEKQQLFELTIANELKIARNNTIFVKTQGTSLNDFFDGIKPYLSLNANKFRKIMRKSSRTLFKLTNHKNRRSL